MQFEPLVFFLEGGGSTVYASGELFILDYKMTFFIPQNAFLSSYLRLRMIASTRCSKSYHCLGHHWLEVTYHIDFSI